MYKNPLPRHDTNVNQVIVMASTSRQMTYGDPLPTKFIDMMGMEPIYVDTCIRRGGERDCSEALL